MRESEIEKKVKEYATSKGWLGIKLTSPNMAGVPDHMFIGPMERVIFIEFKKPGGRLSKLQLRIIQKFSQRGHCIYVIDDIEMGKRLFNECT